MSIKYTILVNTTDSFEDCWIPFFTLFKRYWPDYTGKIYLNTETKRFTFTGLNIIPVQNSKTTPNKRITWSECLMRALNSIDTEVVLYMQEDYFLKDLVKNEIVEKYVRLMQEHTDIHCIHLTDQSVKPEFKSDTYDKLFTVLNKNRDTITCQAALWQKSVLLSYLRPYESAWEFELLGSHRSEILKPNLYVVDPAWIKLNTYEIIPYIFTGVIQGCWFEEVVPLFEKHKIHIDYSKRGFVKDAKPISKMTKLKKRLRRIPILIRHYIEISKKKKS